MFRMWKVAYFTGGWCMPLEDMPDAAGVGGGADLGDAGDGSQPADGDVATGDDGGEGAGVGDADPEEALEDLLTGEEEDDDQRTRPAEERIKALAKRNRKMKRQIAKLLPLSKRLEGVDLDELVTHSRQYKDLAAQIRSNPKLRAILHGDAEPEERRTPTKKEEPEEQFDESALPFDPAENPTNRYFANLAKESFELKKTLKQLQQRVDGVDTREAAKTEAHTRAEWKSTILSAADKIDKAGVRKLFMDNLAQSFNDPRIRAKFTPQQLVGHYLKELESDGLITSQEAKAAAKAQPAAAKPAGAKPSAATAQRIAEQNKTLPRTVAPGGNPAPARNGRPTLDSIKKQITAVR